MLTMEELVGYWKEFSGYTEFRLDGTFFFAADLTKLKRNQYEVSGRYRVEDNQLIFEEDGVCGTRPGVYLINKKEGPLLEFKKVTEECSQRTLPYLRRQE
jgi:hypothetical protein